METFLFGDPRFLSGGANFNCEINYNYAPPVVEGNDIVTTEYLLQPRFGGLTLPARIKAAGQQVHARKSGYHHRPPGINLFLRRNEWPSVGAELETEALCKDSKSSESLQDDLVSNWFHMERDGSLDDENGGEYGFEIITEPLPPRVYRSQETWAGLQNILTPWLGSYGFRNCGLHVHVGLEQFEHCDTLPLRNAADRRRIGKYLSAFVYYCLLNPSFVDRVVLRKNGAWSEACANDEFLRHACEATDGKTTAADAVDIVVGELTRAEWLSKASRQAERIGSNDSAFEFTKELYGFSSHGVEINCDHPYTVEFRRGKGTVNSISVHRTVELMSLIVRYAWKMARNPGMDVSQSDVLRFIAENTTSRALKAMAEKEM